MLNIEYIKLSELKEYKKNARKHTATDIEAIKNSIKEFGMCDPIGIWKNNVIIEGHGRLQALRELGYTEAPCIRLNHLTDEQRRAYAMAHNKTAELSDWDFDVLDEELNEIFDIDMTKFGFDEFLSDEEQFERRMARAEEAEEDEDYKDFVEKFEIKKTTDDCYTPPKIYDAVKSWAVERFNLQGAKIIRPFYPGGDYQSEEYPDNCVVIDNPPFSILSDICRWYTERNIKYFLFAPTLTLFSIAAGQTNYILTDCDIRYENGARVSTSFVTNMGDKKIVINGEFSDRMAEANKSDAILPPKYEYPKEVVCCATLKKINNARMDFEIDEAVLHFIRVLDSQRKEGKAIYGAGFLMSEKVAADKIAADKIAEIRAGVGTAENPIVWELSEKEKEIIDSLGRKNE